MADELEPKVVIWTLRDWLTGENYLELRSNGELMHRGKLLAVDKGMAESIEKDSAREYRRVNPWKVY